MFETKKFVFSIGVGINHQLVDERVAATEFTASVVRPGQSFDTTVQIPFLNKFYDLGTNAVLTCGYKLTENVTISLNARLDNMQFSSYTMGSGFLSLSHMIRENE